MLESLWTCKLQRWTSQEKLRTDHIECVVGKFVVSMGPIQRPSRCYLCMGDRPLSYLGVEERWRRYGRSYSTKTSKHSFVPWWKVEGEEWCTHLSLSPSSICSGTVFYPFSPRSWCAIERHPSGRINIPIRVDGIEREEKGSNG
eukprot:scaffold566_cov364-Pavlova_lutheri.AAC.10